jgi:hypothetical protein
MSTRVGTQLAEALYRERRLLKLQQGVGDASSVLCQNAGASVDDHRSQYRPIDTIGGARLTNTLG